MQKLLGYNNLPAEIKNQITRVVEIWKRHLKEELAGVYLHGSIVLNAFNPGSGDIDILVVVQGPIEVSQKLAIAKDIIPVDGAIGNQALRCQRMEKPRKLCLSLQ